MAYSQQRLERTLAAVRIATGLVFLVTGEYKISSIAYARGGFRDFLEAAQYGGAIQFYRLHLIPRMWDHPGFFATLTGFTEMTLGVGLLLGLAVRPVSLLGMAYMAHLTLATWWQPAQDALLWQHLSVQLPHIFAFFLFLLLGVGHAGELWGLGALYHRRARVREGEGTEAGPAGHHPAVGWEPLPPLEADEWWEEPDQAEPEGMESESERAES
jgi:uncharacterized membrane protein YphA (DoxX/SURF4 family)